MSECLPGSEVSARMERGTHTRTWETHDAPVKTGRKAQQYGGRPVAAWVSDRSTVLGDGRTDHMGKRATR